MRVGLGWEAESNNLRQTALLCAAPAVAAVQLCAPLLPADFKSSADMSAAALASITAAYAALEARYKDWPAERLMAGAPLVE